MRAFRGPLALVLLTSYLLSGCGMQSLTPAQESNTTTSSGLGGYSTSSSGASSTSGQIVASYILKEPSETVQPLHLSLKTTAPSQVSVIDVDTGKTLGVLNLNENNQTLQVPIPSTNESITVGVLTSGDIGLEANSELIASVPVNQGEINTTIDLTP
jgi:hypothetical protein